MGVGRGREDSGWRMEDRRVSKLPNRPTAYPLYPTGYYEANVRPTVAEYLEPSIPLFAFHQQIPLPGSYLSRIPERKASCQLCPTLPRRLPDLRTHYGLLFRSCSYLNQRRKHRLPCPLPNYDAAFFIIIPRSFPRD